MHCAADSNPRGKVTLRFTYGSEKEEWIKEVTSAFNAEDHRLADPIQGQILMPDDAGYDQARAVKFSEMRVRPMIAPRARALACSIRQRMLRNEWRLSSRNKWASSPAAQRPVRKRHS